MANVNPTRVVTGEVRLSYAHLFVPRVNEKSTDKTPKYSVTILIPKSDTATMGSIQTAIQAATAAGVPKVWAQHPAQPQTPIWDGDGVRKSGEPFPPEYKGHWVVTCSSKQPPQVVDINRQPIINQSDVYSGMYAQVSMNFFAFSVNGNKGIGAGLGNVMKTRDGESLAGGKSAEEDFGASDQYANQYASPVPPQYTPPAGQTYAAPAPQQYTPPAGQTYAAPAPQQPMTAAPAYGTPAYGAPAYNPPAPYTPQINPLTGMPM